MMLKTILLGGALALAMPALAQTGSTNPDVAKPPMGTSTNDDRGNTGMTGGPLGNQASTGMEATAGNCSQGSAASAARSANRRGTRGMAASTCGRMNGTASTQGTMSGSMTGQTSAGTDSDWGRTSGATSGTTNSTGTGSTSSWSGGSSAYSGQGGPDTSKTYPACSRTVTDNCMQGGGGRHGRHHRR